MLCKVELPFQKEIRYEIKYRGIHKLNGKGNQNKLLENCSEVCIVHVDIGVYLPDAHVDKGCHKLRDKAYQQEEHHRHEHLVICEALPDGHCGVKQQVACKCPDDRREQTLNNHQREIAAGDVELLAEKAQQTAQLQVKAHLHGRGCHIDGVQRRHPDKGEHDNGAHNRPHQGCQQL